MFNGKQEQSKKGDKMNDIITQQANKVVFKLKESIIADAIITHRDVDVEIIDRSEAASGELSDEDSTIYYGFEGYYHKVVSGKMVEKFKIAGVIHASHHYKSHDDNYIILLTSDKIHYIINNRDCFEHFISYDFKFDGRYIGSFIKMGKFEIHTRDDDVDKLNVFSVNLLNFHVEQWSFPHVDLLYTIGETIFQKNNDEVIIKHNGKQVAKFNDNIVYSLDFAYETLMICLQDTKRITIYDIKSWSVLHDMISDFNHTILSAKYLRLYFGGEMMEVIYVKSFSEIAIYEVNSQQELLRLSDEQNLMFFEVYGTLVAHQYDRGVQNISTYNLLTQTTTNSFEYSTNDSVNKTIYGLNIKNHVLSIRLNRHRALHLDLETLALSFTINKDTLRSDYCAENLSINTDFIYISSLKKITDNSPVLNPLSSNYKHILYYCIQDSFLYYIKKHKLIEIIKIDSLNDVHYIDNDKVIIIASSVIELHKLTDDGLELQQRISNKELLKNPENYLFASSYIAEENLLFMGTNKRHIIAMSYNKAKGLQLLKIIKMSEIEGDERIYCMVSHNNLLFVGTDKGRLRAYYRNGLELVELLDGFVDGTHIIANLLLVSKTNHFYHLNPGSKEMPNLRFRKKGKIASLSDVEKIFDQSPSYFIDICRDASRYIEVDKAMKKMESSKKSNNIKLRLCNKGA